MEDTREFQVFVKPAGAVCNLQCSYCYYLDKKSLYQSDTSFLMDDSTLEKYVIQHIEASTENTITFSWHGGEPLLAGLPFFRKAIQFQKEYKPSEKVIINGIQTNGTLLNDEWCRFLANENFIVGLSIDGPAEIHNKFRITRDGGDTFYPVMNGLTVLKKHGLIPEILCVVNKVNAENPLVIYSFIKGIGARFITFLPLVERISGTNSVSERSVPAELFGSFLKVIFDEWVTRDIGAIKIQIIEEASRTAFDQDHTLCIFKENCGGVPVIEHNGDFYSCDHFVNSENMLGNINNISLTRLLDSERQRNFGRAKSKTLPRYCLKCEVKPMCNGECPKNRFILSPDGEPGLNYLCSGYRMFFNHITPFVEAIAVAWQNR